MFGLFKKKEAAPPSLHGMLFGDVALKHWKPADGAAVSGPWKTFDEVRAALRGKDKQRAQQLLRQLLADTSIESRQQLQTWHFLRELGVQPGAAEAKQVLGVVLEVGLEKGNDTVAAYRDYSARFNSHSGKVIVWESRAPQIDAHIDQLLKAAERVVEKLGSWTEPLRAPPSSGNVRVNLLTPSGSYFGEGAFSDLARDPSCGPVIMNGAKLMGALIGRAS